MSFELNKEITIDTSYYKVKSIKHLTAEAFIINLPKSRFKFKAGQHISMSLKGNYQSREYSIYNGENDENLQLLIKEVEGGYFTPKLKSLKPGDMVEIHGPFGRFSLDESKKETHQHIFIASGTGIAPFHSIANTFPELDFKIIHGVRYLVEGYERNKYNPKKHILCTSRDDNGNFKGRVTDYLKKTNFQKKTIFYLCGNSNMIFDAMEILKEKGFDLENIRVEVYF